MIKIVFKKFEFYARDVRVEIKKRSEESRVEKNLVEITHFDHQSFFSPSLGRNMIQNYINERANNCLDRMSSVPLIYRKMKKKRLTLIIMTPKTLCNYTDDLACTMNDDSVKSVLFLYMRDIKKPFFISYVKFNYQAA